jgi:thiol-disulfide isomerase/thioredoxin
MESKKDKVEILKKAVGDGKHVFLLIYMDGCGPCNETKPKWYEFESKHENDDGVAIVDIEQGSIGDVANIIGESPPGFPCMRYIKNGKVEDYEDCANIDKTKLRSLESFDEWLQEKTQKGKKQEGGSRRRRSTKKRRTRGRRGGKWSMKYKKSINCKRPRGFSQRQHCKYGRKSWKK